jgi:hypothetical protein
MITARSALLFDMDKRMKGDPPRQGQGASVVFIEKAVKTFTGENGGNRDKNSVLSVASC